MRRSPLSFRGAFRLALLLPVAVPVLLLPLLLGLPDTAVGEVAGLVISCSVYGAVPAAPVLVALALLSRRGSERALRRAAWWSPLWVASIVALPLAIYRRGLGGPLALGGIGAAIAFAYVALGWSLVEVARRNGFVERPEAAQCDAATFASCESSSSASAAPKSASAPTTDPRASRAGSIAASRSSSA